MSKKQDDRIPVPQEIADQIIFDNDRTCCVCNEPDPPVEIHHIDEDHTNNSADNLALVCKNCHSKCHRTAKFERKTGPGVIKKYKTNWERRVKEKRKEIVIDDSESFSKRKNELEISADFFYNMRSPIEQLANDIIEGFNNRDNIPSITNFKTYSWSEYSTLDLYQFPTRFAIPKEFFLEVAIIIELGGIETYFRELTHLIKTIIEHPHVTKNSIDEIGKETIIQLIEKCFFTPTVALLPIKYSTEIHENREIFQYEDGCEYIISKKGKIRVIWSNSYIPLNHIILYDRNSIKWVRKRVREMPTPNEFIDSILLNGLDDFFEIRIKCIGDNVDLLYRTIGNAIITDVKQIRVFEINSKKSH